MPEAAVVAQHEVTARWGKVIDHSRCIGCHACSTACKSENHVPLSVNRTYVKYVDVGRFPEARRAYQVTRCNQCDDPPCVAACPTRSMHQRPDGIVDFDKASCIGCKACIAACPYDAIFINPDDQSAEKCNFCAHRLDVGLEPACVVVCPTEAILIGDLNGPRSRLSSLVERGPVAVRRPEKATRPKLFYKGAHQATLDPVAARRPDGGLFMWSEQGRGSHAVLPGHATQGNSSAAALLSYDIPHAAPWDWRVSLYTWTKGIAAGAYLVTLLLVAFNVLPATSPLWQWVAPVMSGGFLALTGLILIWDLEHPERFYYLFTRAQLKSWLVRGGIIIAAYALLLVIHFAASLSDLPAVQSAGLVVGLPLALLTAVYTAYLLAQARARDLWQSPLLPPHLAVQSVLAGSAAMVPFTPSLAPRAFVPLLAMLAISSLIHLLFLLGEGTLTHATAHARLATWEMTRGRYARFYWASVVLVAAGAAAPWLGIAAAPLALAGLLAYEHAYVQSGQAVPLA